MCVRVCVCVRAICHGVCLCMLISVHITVHMCACVCGDPCARARVCVIPPKTAITKSSAFWLLLTGTTVFFSAERICLKTGASISAYSGLKVEKKITSYFRLTSSVFFHRMRRAIRRFFRAICLETCASITASVIQEERGYYCCYILTLSVVTLSAPEGSPFQHHNSTSIHPNIRLR